MPQFKGPGTRTGNASRSNVGVLAQKGKRKRRQLMQANSCGACLLTAKQTCHRQVAQVPTFFLSKVGICKMHHRDTDTGIRTMSVLDPDTVVGSQASAPQHPPVEDSQFWLAGRGPFESQQYQTKHCKMQNEWQFVRAVACQPQCQKYCPENRMLGPSVRNLACNLQGKVQSHPGPWPHQNPGDTGV